MIVVHGHRWFGLFDDTARVKYPLTLAAVVLLIGIILLAALTIPTGDESAQRFTIIVGIVVTTVTALLAVLRTEVNAAKVEATADKVRAVAEEAARRVAATALSVAGDLATTTARLEQKLDANTDISERAFHEANTVNRKIAEQGEMFDRLLSEANARRETAEAELRGVVDSTAVQVGEVHDAIIPAPDAG